MMSVLILIACFAGAAFFAGMETGAIAINRLRLQHMVRRRIRGAQVLQRFLQQPDHLLGTTLVGTNICHIVFSITLVGLMVPRLGAAGRVAATIISSLLLLIFGEYIPKSWFAGFPARRVLPFAPLLRLTGFFLFPISWMITAACRLLFPFGRNNQADRHAFVTRDDLLHLASEGRYTGALTPDEHRMIHGVFGLRGKTCRAVMVPRNRMVHVAHDTSIDELLHIAREKRLQKIPVYDSDQRTFTGIIYLLDILRDEDHSRKTIADYMRPPQFVTEETPVEMLLPRMRVSRQTLILIMDERYEVTGMITLNDVLDEITGKLNT